MAQLMVHTSLLLNNRAQIKSEKILADSIHFLHLYSCIFKIIISCAM